MGKIVFLLLFLAMPVLAGIVRENDAEVIYRQPDGEEVRLPKNPKRTVIAYLSLAKIWEQAGGKAVGVLGARNDNALPESMRDLPKVGAGMLPNAEKVMLLEPDLVLLSAKIERQRASARQLRQSGIAAVCLAYNHYRDYLELLELFCRLHGKSIRDFPEARRTVEEVEAVCRETAGRARPTCAILFASASGFSLEAEGTNAGTVAAMLGAVNILKSSKNLRIPFSFEQFLLEDPEVIFIVTMGDTEALREKVRAEWMSRPVWKELRAAKAGRVHFLPSELFLFLPGPDYPKAFRHMADLLYPGKGAGK